MFYGLGETWGSKWTLSRVSVSRWPRKPLKIVLAILLVVGFITLELRTSWLQSHLFAAAARRLTFSVQAGPSPSIRYSGKGPYDGRLGYSRLPAFLKRLKAEGYDVEAQARISELLLHLTTWGVFPTYREKTQAGLRVLDRDGRALFAARYPQRTYPDFEAIPALVVETLLFIENREILNQQYPYRNPSVEWDRLARAIVDLGLNKLNPEHEITGGSTLATQIEKIRHSPGGRTGSVGEKLRQMASASLRAYQDGEQTLTARKRIICDYINSIPLAARPGYGEVTGLGDGLWVWFGADFDAVNRLLAANPSDFTDSRLSVERARAYRQVLGLLLAINRPSFYLLGNPGELEERIERYVHLISEAGIISPQLRDLALRAPTEFRGRAPAPKPVPFVDRKGSDAIRAELLPLLGLDSAYDLDRLDLAASSTLDNTAQEEVTRVLQRLEDPSYAARAGLNAYQLLSRGDPASVIYSFTLYERGPGVNLLRVQADNYDQPLSVNEGTRLELGSTAKLRTLVTYLEIIAALHDRYAGKPPEELLSVKSSKDPLTQWAADYLLAEAGSLPAMLEAAMNRRYSASPGERFFTGGGMHRFANFDAKDNGRVMTVREAFRRSVNLVFIRLMRDIVRYHMFRVPGASPGVLEDKNDPARKAYLARFADREGRQFLARFYRKYREQTPDQALGTLLADRRFTPRRLAVISRSVRPAAGLDEFAAFLTTHQSGPALPARTIQQLYDKYGPEQFNLSDRGYLARVHPLELWLLEYMGRRQDAGLEDIYAASTQQRQEVYQWLFKTRRTHAQDRRIRILLEADAFEQIHRSWKRQGYPFRSLVPSYATAIGTSGDNPAALAELAGIILNDGVRYPDMRIRRLHFAAQTPVETIMAHRRPGAGQRVFPFALAALVRRELRGVVEHGTGRRAFGAIVLADGTRVPIGGKTGTGDNRFETYARGGRLIDSRVINRTATFVFVLGDRFFGTITAYVPGEQAAGYGFTSALPVQVFKQLAPTFSPLLGRDPQAG